jgi:hypothetical protein
MTTTIVDGELILEGLEDLLANREREKWLQKLWTEI